MKKLLGLAAVIEAATGLALMIHPPLLPAYCWAKTFPARGWRWAAWPALHWSG